MAAFLLASGCGSTPAATPTSTPGVTTSPSASAPACDAGTTRLAVNALLAGRTFETHYLTINGALTISFWVIDPGIDPDATAATLDANSALAAQRGLSLAYGLIDHVPCMRSVFGNVNPMIVDSRYQSWYLDVIPIRLFDGLKNPSPAELVATVSGRETASPIRRHVVPHPDLRPSPSAACTWAQARTSLNTHLSPETGNTAAYLIIGGGLTWNVDPLSGRVMADVGVQLQWVVRDQSQASDDAIVERLSLLAGDLRCLATPIDSLEAFVVDSTGHLLVYAAVAGRLIQAGVDPLPVRQVTIRRDS